MKWCISLEINRVEEISAYKQDSDRWTEEISTLHSLINKYRKDVEDLEADIQKKLKEKDDRIHELLVTIRQTKVFAKLLGEIGELIESFFSE